MFRRLLLYMTSLLVVLAISAHHAVAQNEKLESEISEMMKKYDAVGLSVAVVKKGKIIYTHSFGWKNIEQKVALKDVDIFRIASISKSFSATSIMQLVEAGKLSLNDDFSDLVGFKIRNPNYPDKVITLKMVLSHTSSINDSQGYFNLDVINPEKSANSAKCYNNYEPGTGYSYCNLNFNMVGAVIERTTGERFDNYVKRHVLNPLGLYGGYCVDSLDKSRFTTLYEYDSASKSFLPATAAYASRSEELKTYVMGYSTPIFSPTGGMKISATDLAKYMIMHMNRGKANGHRIISKKSSRLMQTAVLESSGYGLAIGNSTKLIAGKKMTGHVGSAYGLNSAMYFNRKEKFGIVLINNGSNTGYTDGFHNVVKATVNILYENLIK